MRIPGQSSLSSANSVVCSKSGVQKLCSRKVDLLIELVLCSVHEYMVGANLSTSALDMMGTLFDMIPLERLTSLDLTIVLSLRAQQSCDRTSFFRSSDAFREDHAASGWK